MSRSSSEGEASPEGFFKSVLTFQDVVATGCCDSDIFSMGRRPDGPGATWNVSTHTDEFHTDLPRVVQGKAHIPQEKGVPIGRIATQSLHCGS